MTKKMLFFISTTILFFSCNNSNKLKNDTLESNQKKIIDENNIIQQKSFVAQEPDTPLIKPDDDDTLYDDRITIEFSLQDQDGRNFCLYHNIRSIKDWTSNDNKRYTELLRKQEKNDLEIIWSYRNGRIVFMETQDPQYSTKRGIKVGDSVLKVRDLYSDNSQILVYDKELNEYVEKFCAEDNIFLMIESDQGISINARNPVEKVMMSTEFHTTDGIIDKIMISCLDS